MDRCCLSWLGTRVPLGVRNARLGLAPSASSYPAEWNVPAVPRPYPLLLDEGAVPGLAAPTGQRVGRVGRRARGEGGRAIEGGGRWAGAPKTRALRPPAEAPHSRVGHRGHRSACEGLAAGSGGAAAPTQQSRAERSRASAQPGCRRLPHAIAATKSSLNPGGRSSRGCAAQEALSCGSGGRDQTEDGPEEKTP